MAPEHTDEGGDSLRLVSNQLLIDDYKNMHKLTKKLYTNRPNHTEQRFETEFMPALRIQVALDIREVQKVPLAVSAEFWVDRMIETMWVWIGSLMKRANMDAGQKPVRSGKAASWLAIPGKIASPEYDAHIRDEVRKIEYERKEKEQAQREKRKWDELMVPEEEHKRHKKQKQIEHENSHGQAHAAGAEMNQEARNPSDNGPAFDNWAEKNIHNSRKTDRSTFSPMEIAQDGNRVPALETKNKYGGLTNIDEDDIYGAPKPVNPAPKATLPNQEAMNALRAKQEATRQKQMREAAIQAEKDGIPLVDKLMYKRAEVVVEPDALTETQEKILHDIWSDTILKHVKAQEHCQPFEVRIPIQQGRNVWGSITECRRAQKQCFEIMPLPVKIYTYYTDDYIYVGINAHVDRRCVRVDLALLQMYRVLQVWSNSVANNTSITLIQSMVDWSTHMVNIAKGGETIAKPNEKIQEHQAQEHQAQREPAKKRISESEEEKIALDIYTMFFKNKASEKRVSALVELAISWAATLQTDVQVVKQCICDIIDNIYPSRLKEHMEMEDFCKRLNVAVKNRK